MSTPARPAATMAERVHSRASSRRSAPLTSPNPTLRVVAAEARPDAEVGPQAVLEVLRAEHALVAVAAPLRDARRAGVLDVDDQLDARQLEHVEAPAGEQVEGTRRDPLPAGL